MEKAVRNISSRFMYQWMLRFGLASLLGSALLLFVLRESLTQELGQDFGGAFQVLRNLQGFLLPIVSFSVSFYVVVVSVLVVIMVFYLSHSIADPLFRIERVAEHIRRGDFTCSAGPYSGDQLEDLLSAIEELQTQHSTQLASLKVHFEAIDSAWQRLDGASTEPYDETAKEVLAAVGEHLGLIEESFQD